MISVIIPLYNKEATIRQSLKSVLSQDFSDIEVIVVNDGSTDRSAEVVKGVEDARIVFIEQKNGGPSKARNRGIQESKGDYIYFIDADDEIESGALRHFFELTLEYPEADMIIGSVYGKIGKEKYVISRCNNGWCKNNFQSIALNRIKPCTGSVLYRRSLCIENPFDNNLRRYEDYECFFRKSHSARLFMTSQFVLCINQDFCEASKGRADVNEDFVGHLDFKGKSFWEKICLYNLYLGERPYYKDQCQKLYPRLRYRFDLLLLSKILIF